MDAYDINYLFPPYLYPQNDNLLDAAETERRPNLSPEFVGELSERLGLRFVADGGGDLAQTFGPEDMFHYAYAVFHSPGYRERYAEFLKRDFPDCRSPRIRRCSPRSRTRARNSSRCTS